MQRDPWTRFLVAVDQHPVIPALLPWKIPKLDLPHPGSTKLKSEFNVYFPFVIQHSLKVSGLLQKP